MSGDEAGKASDDRKSEAQRSSVLGLVDETGAPVQHADWREFAHAAPGTVFEQPEPAELMELTVIVPARNEEASLGECLQSLVGQSEDIFELGRDWELIVVDDHSMDSTVEVASKFTGVTVMKADALQQGWTGKNNAVWTAARKARGKWLLFTDADTIHEPGDLRRAMHEAERHKAGVLSYSPKQVVTGFAQRILMPLIFSELTLAYPPGKVSDPGQKIAAANGQFLLIEREAYRRLGGHAGVREKILEDVELAFAAKRRRVGLWFRYAEDAVSARMYRTTSAMIEGWTKNLALLFNNTIATALWRALDFVLLFGLPLLAFEFWNAKLAMRSVAWMSGGWILGLLWIRTLVRFYARVAKSNFPFVDCLISPLGLPLFVVLLYRSWFMHRVVKRVVWKGRTYGGERRG
jgi:glycosyltransferase involved in cell wall biosynthesis